MVEGAAAGRRSVQSAARRLRLHARPCGAGYQHGRRHPGIARHRSCLGTGGRRLGVAGLWIADAKFSVDWPIFTGSNFKGGKELTPELSTILIGLTIYTTGFVAEIVRGGVLSVGRGQWDAGHSLGLPRGKILRLIIIPQMLRVIVPPLNSQYINVVKNSTLAIAVGYPDFLAVMNTIISKSSHSIEGVFIILGVYLALNLSLSSAANWYNRRIAIVER
ncbi:MAG: ABC transporter permease subunit [Mesorhizobium sp.]|nr:MAG: ABC transporter permease subunit [Mesorhizobium sp.]